MDLPIGSVPMDKGIVTMYRHLWEVRKYVITQQSLIDTSSYEHRFPTCGTTRAIL